MKATKKILCITLALVVAGLALIMPISASSADLPVIVVDGIGTTPLYQNFDTEDEKLVFDDATIEALIRLLSVLLTFSSLHRGRAEELIP